LDTLTLKKVQWQHFHANKQTLQQMPQRKRTTKELHLEKERERSGKEDVDSRIMQVEGWRKMEAAAQN